MTALRRLLVTLPVVWFAVSCGDGGTNPGPAPVASVTVTPALDTIAPAATVQLTATPKDGSGNALSGRTITWSSSDALIANVSATGLVTGKSGGTATVTASSEGKSGNATIVVVPPLVVGGTWVFAESLADIPNGVACYDTATISITQDGSSFTGTALQTGTCTTPSGPVDNGGTFAVTNGVVAGTTIDFDEPGSPPCHYTGTLTGDPPSSVAGTVSCVGSGFNLSGTWHADHTGLLAVTVGASGSSKPGIRFAWARRVPGSNVRAQGSRRRDP